MYDLNPIHVADAVDIFVADLFTDMVRQPGSFEVYPWQGETICWYTNGSWQIVVATRECDLQPHLTIYMNTSSSKFLYPINSPEPKPLDVATTLDIMVESLLESGSKCLLTQMVKKSLRHKDGFECML